MSDFNVAMTALPIMRLMTSPMPIGLTPFGKVFSLHICGIYKSGFGKFSKKIMFVGSKNPMTFWGGR